MRRLVAIALFAFLAPIAYHGGDTIGHELNRPTIDTSHNYECRQLPDRWGHPHYCPL